MTSSPSMHSKCATSTSSCWSAMRGQILATGRCVPDRIVSSHDLVEGREASDAWVVQRAEIRQRRFVDFARAPMGTGDMASLAAQRALVWADRTAVDVELILSATLSPDRLFRGAAVALAAKLGLCACYAGHGRSQPAHGCTRRPLLPRRLSGWPGVGGRARHPGGQAARRRRPYRRPAAPGARQQPQATLPPGRARWCAPEATSAGRKVALDVELQARKHAPGWSCAQAALQA